MPGGRKNLDALQCTVRILFLLLKSFFELLSYLICNPVLMVVFKFFQTIFRQVNPAVVLLSVLILKGNQNLLPTPGAQCWSVAPLAGPSPVLLPGHALLVDGSGQLLGVGEDVVVVEDDGLDHLIDVGLAGHLVQGVWRWQQGWPEDDG